MGFFKPRCQKRIIKKFNVQIRTVKTLRANLKNGEHLLYHHNETMLDLYDREWFRHTEGYIRVSEIESFSVVDREEYYCVELPELELRLSDAWASHVEGYTQFDHWIKSDGTHVHLFRQEIKEDGKV